MQILYRLYVGFYTGNKGAIKQVIRPRVSLDTIY
jgi:hypothetical protein